MSKNFSDLNAKVKATPTKFIQAGSGNFPLSVKKLD